MTAMKRTSIQASPSSHTTYRADLDGLRAIAVLSVVAYHAFPQVVRGGFIGVDVFFVISGFLISTILFKNVNQGQIGFLDFYGRRIRRIFPALVLVLAFCFSVGWYVLLPHEYKQLGEHIAAGAGFVSNFMLWGESGYFDNTADTKPLLHLWSLGIEEQFYILWPVLLWLLTKLKVNVFWLAIMLAITSFAANFAMVYAYPVATFYSPLTRSWELLTGAILASIFLKPPRWISLCVQALSEVVAFFAPRGTRDLNLQRLGNLAAFVGVVAIVIGLFMINRGRHYPGLWGLAPTFGTGLIIAAGSAGWINKRLLSHPILVWFGLISFPLYLWHWPLLSFARIIEGQPTSVWLRICVVVLSVVLAWLTYRLIERPIRNGLHNRIKTLVLVGLTAVVGSAGYLTFEQNGLTGRGPILDGIESGNDGGYQTELSGQCGLSSTVAKGFVCLKDSRNPIRYALLGDSKAEAIFTGFVRTSTNHGRWLIIAKGSNYNAVPIISDHPGYADFQPGAKIAIEAIAQNPDIDVVVVVAGTRNLFKLKNDTDIVDLESSEYYAEALQGLQKAVDRFTQAGKKVVMVIDNPTLPHPEDCVERKTSSSFINMFLSKSMNLRCQISVGEHLRLSRKYRDLLKELATNNQSVVSLFDTTPFMCDEQRGVCESKRNEKRMYLFTDHVSDYAAGLIGKAVNAYLAELVELKRYPAKDYQAHD